MTTANNNSVSSSYEGPIYSTYNISGDQNGFWWDGVWHEVRPSAGDDDGPPTGVREPRRPRPFAPAGAMALDLDIEEHA